MRILFIHPNFPAQFRHLATHFAADTANEVVFACTHIRPEWNLPNVRKVQFGTKFVPPKEGHRLAGYYEQAVAQGEAGYVLCRKLAASGFVPDVVVGHSGWGATMFVRDALPDVPFVGYFEWFYNARSADMTFDPDDRPGEAQLLNLRTRNAVILNDLESCTLGMVPTLWQARQFPKTYRKRLTVRHDGVDTRFFAPLGREEWKKGLVLPGLDLSGVREIVTYATRGMEPYRGFPQFMQSLPVVLERRPRAHVIIVGEDRVCYGKSPAQGGTWKEAMLEYLRGAVPAEALERVHFTGSLPYGQYRAVLQHSLAHVYLTRPFVLSWSMLEAMSCGVPLIASGTDPVREVVTHGENGVLVDFFSPQAIADAVCQALADPAAMMPLRRKARQDILQRYSLERLLPGHARLVRSVVTG